MDEQKRMEWARFRFSVIAPLVIRRHDSDSLRSTRAGILASTHLTPEGEEKSISERTLRAWVARYKQYGFDGLKRMSQPTRGQHHAIPDDILDKAEELRREKSTRSVRTILSLLKAQSIDISGISKSTLNFHLNRRGAPRDKHASEIGTFQRFQKEHANDLWQADTSGGIWLPDPHNRKTVRQTRFISFIDDATRVVTWAQFYWSEQVPSLFDCLRKALLSRGKPGALYCDNGPVYISKALAKTCAQLGIELIHAKEYFPEGKGKIEKHIGTVKSGFYSEAKSCGLTSLDDLNTFFFAWLQQEYHDTEHSALKMTPFERWKQDEDKGFIKLVTAADIRRALMIRDERKVNKRTSTVSLNNRLYRVGKELAGKKVEVRWEADKPKAPVEIWYDGKLIDTAHELIPGKDIDFNLRPERERRKGPPPILDSSKKYMESLVANFKQTIPSVRDTYLSEVEFQQIMARLLNRELSSEERDYLSAFYHDLSPLPDSIVETTISKAVASKGDKLHVRSYLDSLKQSIFDYRSK